MTVDEDQMDVSRQTTVSTADYPAVYYEQLKPTALAADKKVMLGPPWRIRRHLLVANHRIVVPDGRRGWSNLASP